MTELHRNITVAQHFPLTMFDWFMAISLLIVCQCRMVTLRSDTAQAGSSGELKGWVRVYNTAPEPGS